MTATTLTQGTTARDDDDLEATKVNQTWAIASHGGVNNDQPNALVGKLYQLYGQSRERERAIATSSKAWDYGVRG